MTKLCYLRFFELLLSASEFDPPLALPITIVTSSEHRKTDRIGLCSGSVCLTSWRAWALNLCLVLSRPFGQTHFSDKRVRLAFDTNFLCGLGSEVDVLDEGGLGEEKSDGNGVNLTLSTDIKETG